jgi:proteasome beta subunit
VRAKVGAEGGPFRYDEPIPRASFISLLESRGIQPVWTVDESAARLDIPEATTILAVRFSDGVVMAGDRRATAGNLIAHDRVKKVYAADRFSAVAISGTAGMAIELVKLFQTELEHYEKIEGTRLSLDGKANYLARMVRGHLPLAFQGLAVVPLFCGYDERARSGKLFSFDVVGGRYEEQEYATTGSGGGVARSFLKGVYEGGLTEDEAVQMAVEALVAAAEEDSATGGPDLRRRIYPNVVTVTAEGLSEIGEERLATVSQAAVENRP